MRIIVGVFGLLVIATGIAMWAGVVEPPSAWVVGLLYVAIGCWLTTKAATNAFSPQAGREGR